MTSSEEAFLKKLRAAFVGEAHEQIERISSGLSQLTSIADELARQVIIENTFRELHNMKGSARAVNLLTLEAVCQLLEDVFAELKREERKVTPRLMDVLHESVDSVSGVLTKLEADESFQESADLEGVLERLQKNLEISDKKSADHVRSEQSHSEPSRTEPSRSEQSRSEESRLEQSRSEQEQSIVELSRTETNEKQKSPDEKEESAESILNSFAFDPTWQESTTQGALQDALKTIPQGSPDSLLPGSHASSGLFSTPPQSFTTASTIDSTRESIRIPAARLDELLMRAEDMLSLKIMSRQHNHDLNNVGFKFDHYTRDLSKIYADVRAARQLIDRDLASVEELFIESVLGKVLEFLDLQQQQLSALSAQLTTLKTGSLNDYRVASSTVDTFLENTKKLLMMPASTMLELMPKLVRDLARELGKEIDLTISGSAIQLDKRVLAQVKDPLVHILRNSIDHGMEKPEARAESGKSPRGTLTISVLQQEGNTVEIVVTDDGAGINIERVKEIAVKNNLIDRQRADAMTDEEAIPLIFQSSFSTSSTISEISGRGLGLAIAKENIEHLGGRLIVESRRGLGTTFRIKLPVTVATFRGVLIKCSDEILIVPTSDMERLVKVKKEQVKTSDSGQTIEVDGQEVPFLRLNHVLELPTSPANSTHHLVMVLRHSEAKCAFEIDDVLEEQEILVKKLAKPLVRVRNVAGVTVLGSGKPSAILNVSDLLKSATKMAALKVRPETDKTPAAVKRILVVDDTITARILMKNILESAGYLIKTANDGAEALKLLEKEQFDLLVTDIEMPKMNGIELTAAVRERGQSVPIILVTSMTDQHFREKGTEAGADAFFVKSSFDQNNLLDVIKRLI
ncbi:MAG: response regulator [Cyanobacteria bacterium SZAS-4]|nr:response regulator [Cyanobacteria bacterium SZAS-4]